VSATEPLETAGSIVAASVAINFVWLFASVGGIAISLMLMVVPIALIAGLLAYTARARRRAYGFVILAIAAGVATRLLGGADAVYLAVMAYFVVLCGGLAADVVVQSIVAARRMN
jgi:hypothetical protein